MYISFNKVISASLSPNTDSDDVWLAFKTMMTPWTWKHGKANQKVEQWFVKQYPSSVIASFNSGRCALFALLQSFDIGEGDEVLLQAFTCVAVPNSVKWTGATPVFIDIDETVNIDVRDAEKKLTSKAKALIVQHTFGVPAQMDTIVGFCKKHNLILIEDCAHSLGATFKRKAIGSFGDAAFFSFGRDKVVSSVWGGVSTKYKVQSTKLIQIQENTIFPPLFWIFQQLLHPIAFSIILASYNIWIGKLLLFILQRLHFLSKPVYREELTSGKPNIFPAKFPNALALLLMHQLAKLEQMNKNRHDIAKLYRNNLKNMNSINTISDIDGSIFLRFPLLVDNPLEYMRKAKAKGILLGNWYHHVIDPAGVDYRAIGYTMGSCPKAEQVSATVLNLPTRITSQEAYNVISSFT